MKPNKCSLLLQGQKYYLYKKYGKKRKVCLLYKYSSIHQMQDFKMSKRLFSTGKLKDHDIHISLAINKYKVSKVVV